MKDLIMIPGWKRSVVQRYGDCGREISCGYSEKREISTAIGESRLPTRMDMAMNGEELAAV